MLFSDSFQLFQLQQYNSVQVTQTPALVKRILSILQVGGDYILSNCTTCYASTRGTSAA